MKKSFGYIRMISIRMKNISSFTWKIFGLMKIIFAGMKKTVEIMMKFFEGVLKS
jgi:hypothetical protein